MAVIFRLNMFLIYFKLNLPLLLFCFAVSLTTQAQINSTAIDSVMEDALNKFKVAGASISIIKDGNVVHQKGYGFSSIETRIPVTQNTNFQIASNSKSFTAAALSILEDEKKIKWTDRVIDYIPEFKMYNQYVTDNFTIQDLLTHRSGLQTGAGNLMFFPDGSTFTIQDVLTCFQYFKPASAFRTEFGYIDLLYVIAGEVISRVSGMDFDIFVQKRILDPLGMNKSYIGKLKQEKGEMATPHSSESGTIQAIDLYPIGMASAAGGVFSNAEDMSEWMMVFLNKGKYGEGLTNTLFSQKNYNEICKMHTKIDIPANQRYNTHFTGYGLGWVVSDVKGNLKMTHTGGLPGMISTITLFPDINLGIVVLTNTQNGGLGLTTSITNTITDAYLGLDDFGWNEKLSAMLNQNETIMTEELQNVLDKVRSLENTKFNSKKYIGIYKDKWFGDVEIFENNNQLWIKSYRSPKLNGQMYFYEADSFVIKWKYHTINCDAFATFDVDNAGNTVSVKLKTILPNNDFDFHNLNLDRVVKTTRHGK